MGLVKITFDGSNVSAKQDADINFHVTGLVEAGIIRGLGNELAVSASNNYITFKSGYVQIYGRRIYVEEGSQVYISLDSTKQGYVIIQVDLNNNSVSLSKVEGTTLPKLTQQNLHTTGTIYQMPIVKYTKTTTSLTLDSSFKPTYIETPLSVANEGFNNAVEYIGKYRTSYMKFVFTTTNKATVSLSDEEYENYKQTLFMIRLNIGLVIPIIGFSASPLSYSSTDYYYDGQMHTLLMGSDNETKSLALVCNTTSHIIKAIYAYR